MILVEISFGRGGSNPKTELEDLVQSYFAALFHNGQLCGEFFMTWIAGEIICHALMAGLGANKTRWHSPWGKSELDKVIKVFGGTPVWTIRDDDLPKRNTSWRARMLHLFTNAFDWNPPLCRGDTGKPIPTFLLPVTAQLKQDIYGWQGSYATHDQLWLSSGTLEIPAYKELAEPGSGLSSDGRHICAEIEKATGIPTYYFLMRYYFPAEGADNRPCPGCAGPWYRFRPDGASFHDWPFRCDRCRLVSTAGVTANKGLAKIGAWREESLGWPAQPPELPKFHRSRIKYP